MPYSKALMKKAMVKLDLSALNLTLTELNWTDVKPLFLKKEITDVSQVDLKQLAEDEEFRMNLHDICCKRHISQGSLICRNCNREYIIKGGVINMLLLEDEVEGGKQADDKTEE